jgi:hypothetical protein
MPLAHRIDHRLRLVLAWASGTVTDEEVFGYQNEVWSRPDGAGYDELVDMTAVEHVALPSIGRVLDLAALSSGMDAKGSKSRFAIVAPRDFEFALGRLYGTHRELDTRATKRVSVFRSRPEALAWLGLEGEPPGDP